MGQNRNELLARLPENAVCAEIGVWKGNFSAQILEQTKPRELHLVDPWRFDPSFPVRWYGGGSAKSQTDMDAIHNSVVSRFAARAEVRIHRARSADAVHEFDDNLFDWIYVDGDHSYDAVLDDLRSWRRKLKPRGLLAGDDLWWKDESGDLSVRRALNEFATEIAVEPELLPGGQFLMQFA